MNTFRGKVHKSRPRGLNITIRKYSNTEGCKFYIALPQIYFCFHFISNLWGLSFLFPHLEKGESLIYHLFYDLYTAVTAVLACIQQRIKLVCWTHTSSSILLYLLMFLLNLQNTTTNSAETSFASSLWILLSGTAAFIKGSEATKSYPPNTSHWLSRLTPPFLHISEWSQRRRD